MKRQGQRGLTLVELIVAFTIMLLLATMAVPLARYRVRREKERELRLALREIKTAIDATMPATPCWGRLKSEPNAIRRIWTCWWKG